MKITGMNENVHRMWRHEISLVERFFQARNKETDSISMLTHYRTKMKPSSRSVLHNRNVENRPIPS